MRTSSGADHLEGFSSSRPLPLAGLRVIDLTDGKGEMCGRVLADLGADVVLVEPRAGSGARRRAPLVDGASLYFATHNANKRSVALDLDDRDDRRAFLALVDGADVVVDGTRPGTMERWGLDASTLLVRRPSLVVCSLTDFGLSGPYRDLEATGPVLMALGGLLCRSGLPGLPPLLPPAELAYETVAVQAAWCVLLAVWNARSTGRGDHLDVSSHEVVAQILDPGLGITGSARAGATARTDSRGRPDASSLYPIYATRDGHVRICVLSVRQWHNMRGWLGDPPALMDPSYDSTAHRLTVGAGDIHPYVARLFAQHTSSELVAEGQRRGVPIAEVRDLSAVFDDEHFVARSTFVDVGVGPDPVARAPFGYVHVNGAKAGIRGTAPALGGTDPYALGWDERRDAAPTDPGARNRPLAGLRVLDLGVIVVGAELGRLFADQGAEVIKIENREYPDGSRQSVAGEPMTPSFASGHRGKLSMGLNLRTPEGKEVFEALVASSDVVLSNFKPGTLESLGFGPDVLRRINPRIVVADSSALGASGPKSRSMGYGPLVRAETGLTRLWSYPGMESGFCDAITIFPDHFAARVVAVSALACLLDRESSGVGGHVTVSQADTILTALSERIAVTSLADRPDVVTGARPAVDVVAACAGDDEWCVVSIRDQRDLDAVAAMVGLRETGSQDSPGTVVDRLVDWTRHRPPVEVTARLQAMGVPAGTMVRLDDYATDPQFLARGFIRSLEQPGLDDPLPTENAPCLSRGMLDPALRPAPFFGENTRDVAARVVGLDADEVDRLLAIGVLQTGPEAPVRAALTLAPAAGGMS